MMDILIWTGAAISLIGLLGIVWCILKVAKAKRSGMDDAQLREAVGKIVPLNLGALFLSVIGLMIVILGIFLG